MTNLNELKPTINLNPFARFCCTIGNLPSSYMSSLTYEEQLLWLCDYLENTIIPSVNNNAECVKELQELYVELKNYVDNYFTNLDVQDEINNKLDKMATNGQLKIIVESFFNSLKLANVLNYGAVGDGINDDTDAFINALASNLPVYIPEGIYKITNTLNIKNNEIFGTKNSIIELTEDVNLFNIGFHTKIHDLTIKNKNNIFTHSIFECSSATFLNENGNFADIEIYNINLPYFDDMPTSLEGTCFLIYANDNIENGTKGFWGVYIHNITNFQNFKYFIRHYARTVYNHNIWITGTTFKDINCMRFKYFYFGLPNDNSLNADGYEDGDYIDFERIQLQCDVTTQYAYVFTSGGKNINDSIVMDWGRFFNPENRKPFLALTQNINTYGGDKGKIIINSELGSILDRCQVYNRESTLNSLQYYFNYKNNSDNNNILYNQKGKLLEDSPGFKYYKLGTCNLKNNNFQAIFNYIFDTRYLNKYSSPLITISIEGIIENSQMNIILNTSPQNIDYKNLPIFYYKLNDNEITLYMKVYSNNPDNSRIIPLFDLSNLYSYHNHLMQINPTKIDSLPLNSIEINLSDLLLKIPNSNNAEFENIPQNKGLMIYDNTFNHLRVGIKNLGAKFIPYILAVSSDNRPSSGIVQGQMIFDTTLQKPIWFNGSVWKDSNGNTV